MFNNISWTSYWSVIIILIIFYYGFILLIYYRNELGSRLHSKPRIISPGEVQLTHFELTSKEKDYQNEVLSDRNPEEEEKVFPMVQTLIDETIAFLAQTGYNQTQKEEILKVLQKMVSKYPMLKGSTYELAICNLLKFECENKCAVHLNDEEIRQLWMG